MKNANEPAAPTFMHDVKMGLALHKTNDTGLTKREMIAMHIMANTCWNTTDRNQPQHYQYAAESAVSLTDALLKELDR